MPNQYAFGIRSSAAGTTRGDEILNQDLDLRVGETCDSGSYDSLDLMVGPRDAARAKLNGRREDTTTDIGVDRRARFRVDLAAEIWQA